MEGLTIGGNPCPDPEKPFPCKSSLTCIPMAYVCDQNDDCEDAYDEDRDVCTAGQSAYVNCSCDAVSWLKGRTAVQ